MDPLYAFVWLVGRFWLWFFFKAVEVRHPERVPRKEIFDPWKPLLREEENR